MQCLGGNCVPLWEIVGTVCTEDIECLGEAFYCLAETCHAGLCVDDDCPEGQYCELGLECWNFATPGAPCIRDEMCDGVLVCRSCDNTCGWEECNIDFDCSSQLHPGTDYCLFGKCKHRDHGNIGSHCTEPLDCSVGLVCDMGVGKCHEKQCGTDNECGELYICDYGICKHTGYPGDYCEPENTEGLPVVNCIDPWVCTNNRCWAEGCATDADCLGLGMSYCTFGVCYGAVEHASEYADPTEKGTAAYSSQDK